MYLLYAQKQMFLREALRYLILVMDLVRRYGKYAYSPPVLFPMFLKVLIALENPCALMFSLKLSWFM